MSNTSNPPYSPVLPQPRFLSSWTSSLTSILRSVQSGTNDAEPTPKRQKYIQLTQEQFDNLLQMKTSSNPTTNPPRPSLSTIPSITPLSIPTSIPSYYNNANYEDITCKGITPSYYGSKDNLIPFLTLISDARMKVGNPPRTALLLTAATLPSLTLHAIFPTLPSLKLRMIPTSTGPPPLLTKICIQLDTTGLNLAYWPNSLGQAFLMTSIPPSSTASPHLTTMMAPTYYGP
jgi:hypothetical protein